MEACGKDILSVSFFSCKYGKKEYQSYRYIVFLSPCAVNIFILIIADWCRTGITRGPDRTQEYKAFSADNCILMFCSSVFCVFALMGKELVQPVGAPSSVSMSASIYGE